MTFWLISKNYIALFLWSFLASTLVPVGSEWYLAALSMQSHDPLILLCVATAGNVLGAVSTYAVGFFGRQGLEKNILRMKPETLEKAHGVFMKYGVWTLLFSWLPVLGDAFCLVGGMMKTPMAVFLPLVFMGKCLRYLFILSLVPGLDFF